ncbi:hypothetical protein [Hymenobacter sp. GOD-10R]|uniref:hypothetical protein n=1 Tax=Hymenobacter sp. GOD-10R TaxID=3093922 RepID=UPI002D76A212|nr:hypothetical protein [Hymenobacter sp. GOD-10R]WRQ27833.1 hypothetical protein SD425_22435 [Hymenobacter sp. GOD-10R]
MAEINIQRKKASPSPWLLVLLLILVLGAIGYFLFRPNTDSRETPVTPSATSSAASTLDTVASTNITPPADENVAAMATEEPTTTAEALASFATTQVNDPDYGRRGLRMLSGLLIDLTDREDLQDRAVSEKRDNLTSATSRLEETTMSLRPGCVAAAALMQAMQQKAYPQLERSVAELNEQALQLTGRAETDDKQALQGYFVKAVEIVKALSQPAS